MLGAIRRFLAAKNGVSAVEFALTIPFFIFLVSLIFELVRIALLSAYLDLAISEGTRAAKNRYVASGDYQRFFEQYLNRERLWRVLNGDGEFKVEVKYADDVDGLVKEQYRQPQKTASGELISPTGASAGLASYSFDYHYSAWIPLIPKLKISPIFKRRMVVVQEYERTEFPFKG